MSAIRQEASRSVAAAVRINSTSSVEGIWRPLDTTEALFAAFNEAGAFLTVRALEVHGPLTETLLLQALTHVEKRHPLLRARIIPRGDSLFWAEGPTTSPRISIVDHVPPGGLEALTEVELHRTYADDQRATMAMYMDSNQQGPSLDRLGNAPRGRRWDLGHGHLARPARHLQRTCRGGEAAARTPRRSAVRRGVTACVAGSSASSPGKAASIAFARPTTDPTDRANRASGTTADRRSSSVQCPVTSCSSFGLAPGVAARRLTGCSRRRCWNRLARRSGHCLSCQSPTPPVCAAPPFRGNRWAVSWGTS